MFVGLCWKIYNGVKKTTRQKAAIFVIDRKSFDTRLQNSSRAEKDFMWDLYKKAISQLTRLRHPQILTVQHPLEESRDCLAFATEPVINDLIIHLILAHPKSFGSVKKTQKVKKYIFSFYIATF
jgi:SCY1-like protein 2